MNILEVKHLTKSFNKKEIVKDISFNVEKGQLTAMLGPSGCGKTTTLRMIAGLEIPDKGEIWIGDMLASHDSKMIIPQKHRHIGMVFQDLALWPHMTVYENIEFGLKASGHNKTERQKKIGMVLSKVNMQKYAKVYPGKLSGGQQQLVAIARAIVTEPRLLLMDEPLSNLDARLREEIRNEIRRIQQEIQITTVYVTHDQEDAFLLANNLAVMHEGEIEQTGTPEEIYTSPKSLFVAHFIGESNIVGVKIVGRNRILTPWGEWKYDTEGRERGDVFLFFRPHDAVIEKEGSNYGVITNRDYVGGKYKYHIAIYNGEVKIEDSVIYDVGQSVRFSIKKMCLYSGKNY